MVAAKVGVDEFVLGRSRPVLSARRSYQSGMCSLARVKANASGAMAFVVLNEEVVGAATLEVVRSTLSAGI